MAVLRQLIGDELRRRRHEAGRTLRDVSGAARVSLGYLSEVERGRKEASSELLDAICEALQVPLSGVLRSVSDDLALHELLDAEAAAPSAGTSSAGTDTLVGRRVIGPSLDGGPRRGDVVDLAA